MHILEVDILYKIIGDIFKKHTNIDFEKDESLWDIPLFGYKLNVPIREMVLIVGDLSDIIEYTIVEESILNGEFQTYRKIRSLLSENMFD